MIKGGLNDKVVEAVKGFATPKNPIFGVIQYQERMQLHRFLPVSSFASVAVS